VGWAKLYTSFDGRIGRRGFWIGAGLLFGLMLAAGTGLNLVLEYLVSRYSIRGVTMMSHAITAFQAVLAVFFLPLFAKRWHDRDRSGWWSLIAAPLLVASVLGGALVAVAGAAVHPLVAAPFIAVGAAGAIGLMWLLIELGALEGTRGKNRFGSDPRARRAASASTA
jgi:uncharacterized membrane protein YhaH (DUF805 family)